MATKCYGDFQPPSSYFAPVALFAHGYFVLARGWIVLKRAETGLFRAATLVMHRLSTGFAQETHRLVTGNAQKKEFVWAIT